MKGPDFWQICILAEYDQHRTMPTVWDSIKKSLFSKLAFIFFSYHDQFPVFLTSSHHCKLCPQHLYRRTSSSFGDFALKYSLHLKAINHATITTRCVTVLLFISRFQVATLHLCLKQFFNEKCRKSVLKIHCFQINKEMILIVMVSWTKNRSPAIYLSLIHIWRCRRAI